MVSEEHMMLTIIQFCQKNGHSTTRLRPFFCAESAPAFIELFPALWYSIEVYILFQAEGGDLL